MAPHFGLEDAMPAIEVCLYYLYLESSMIKLTDMN
jgi:hypothetical protein